ncbi:tetratricopeptide repeat protein [Catenulispora sp. NL8]|uniref:Tetratricopeptide repeat protein n=1 Tax=Catenulispora pinistramenti TaxID=2705254 RepID=A0ABS5L022_9ACTN|nr:BTAD domain-containing putative transcriptional regulator [Catenulispora pinistramenti]MBS2551675.1 tetratricopeptide repeat protein [Catenulispora pinistramenti]
MTEFRLLGDMQAWHADQQLELGGHQQKCVLAVLLLHPRQAVPTKRIVAYAWPPDPPSTAEKLVAGYIARLRKILEPAGGISLRSRPPGYVAEVDPELVDAHRFTALIRQARADHEAADDEQAEAHLRRALGMWRGIPLADLDSPWLRDPGLALEQSRLDALEELAEIDLRADRVRETIAMLRGPHADHPERERLAALLVRALHAAGEPAQAAQTAAAAVRSVRALGLEPGRVLRQAQQDALTNQAPGRQARSVQGRHQLPTPTRAFTGRAEELQRLTDTARAVSEGSVGTVVITAIDGMGGIGKTSLALRAAHDIVDRFPDGQLFIDLRGYTDGLAPLTADQALHSVLSSLGVPPQRIPADPQARAAFYRDRLAGTRTLIILDNALNTAQVKPLLPSSAGCLVVITSRGRLTGLDDAENLPLDVLTEADATALFHKIAGPGRLPADDPMLPEVLALCGFLPLAIRIIAARLRHRRALRTDHLVRQLRDEHGRLGHLQDDDRSLAAAFELSFRHLPAAEQNLFRHLGLVPGPDFDTYAAANLADTDLDSVERLLDSLLDQNLLVQRAPGRYRFHDLVRLYARSLVPVPADDTLAALPEGGSNATTGSLERPLERLLGYYVHTAHAADELVNPRRVAVDIGVPEAGYLAPSPFDLTAALAWFDAEYAGLLAAQQAAAVRGWHSAVWRLAWMMNNFQLRRGYLRDQVTCWQVAVAAVERLGDPSLLSPSHRLLGMAHARVGAHTEALGHLEQALDFAGRHGDVDHEARAHNALVVVWSEKGDDERALTHATQALRLYQALGESRLVATALNAVGWCALRLGRYDEARAASEQALVMCVESGDRHGESANLDTLGSVAQGLGEHRRALDYFSRAQVLTHELGNTYQEAGVLDRLAQAHAALGRSSEARSAWRQALSLYQSQHRRADADRVESRLAALDDGVEERPT